MKTSNQVDNQMNSKDFELIKSSVAAIISVIDPDASAETKTNTPTRVANFYKDMMATRSCEVNATHFQSSEYNGIILLSDIPFCSMCEHHMLPFFGTVHVGYIPSQSQSSNKKSSVIGLSKIPRIVNQCAAGLQMQERLTTEIAKKIEIETDADGVCVFINAEHMCIRMRGVNKVDVKTTTHFETGSFKTEPANKRQMMNMLNVFCKR